MPPPVTPGTGMCCDLSKTEAIVNLNPSLWARLSLQPWCSVQIWYVSKQQCLQQPSAGRADGGHGKGALSIKIEVNHWRTGGGGRGRRRGRTAGGRAPSSFKSAGSPCREMQVANLEPSNEGRSSCNSNTPPYCCPCWTSRQQPVNTVPLLHLYAP